MTQAELAERILQNLGMLAAGETADTADAVLVEEAITGAHARLQTNDLAPFELTAVPEQSQMAMINYVSADLAGFFGISGERLQVILAKKSEAMRELRKQAEVKKPPIPVKATYF